MTGNSKMPGKMGSDLSSSGTFSLVIEIIIAEANLDSQLGTRAEKMENNMHVCVAYLA